jgi:hypothetical protein
MQARHSRGARVLAAAFAAVLLAVFGAAAGSASAGSPQATRTGEWQQAMQRLPLPGRGCFSAAFPAVNVLTAPFGFQQFYGTYASSWRVPAGRSLLAPCGRKAASGSPATPTGVTMGRILPPQPASASRRS